MIENVHARAVYRGDEVDQTLQRRRVSAGGVGPASGQRWPVRCLSLRSQTKARGLLGSPTPVITHNKYFEQVPLSVQQSRYYIRVASVLQRRLEQVM